jgi:pre-mRNA-splicing factor ATP-dependent RNA helicase DHX16
MPKKSSSGSRSNNVPPQVMEWCSDQLHELMGYSDSNLANYLIHVATKAKSAGDASLQTVLQQGDIPVEKQAAFCQALLQKCQPPKQKKKLHNADWVEKAKEYSLLDDDHEIDQGEGDAEEDLDLDLDLKRERKSSKKPQRREEKSSNSSTSKKERLREKKRQRRRRRDDDDDDSDGGNNSNSGGDNSKGSDGGGGVVKQESLHVRRERRRQREDEQQQRKRRQKDKDKNNKEGKEDDALTPEQRAELEREKDLRERDEFVQRMLERDKGSTKQLAEAKQEEGESDKDFQKRLDDEARLARGETVIGDDGDEMTLEKLRMESRRAYLKKRQDREVTLLKQSLQDEQELFKDQKLTETERKRIALSKQILKMVEKNEGQADEDQQQDGFYRLPGEYDEKDTKGNQDKALLSSRYVEPKQEKSEQELWEESQTRKAELPKKKKKKKDPNEKEYELVFDDQIDFVMQETTKGYDKRDKKRKPKVDNDIIKMEEEADDVKSSELEIMQLTEHQKLLEVRRKLPVFPYREEFLAAVKDHQILVLVGETGSGKTTQIPQYLHEIGYSELGKIGCTQPRRVAAMSVAARVAQEMNVRLGHEVGYSIRFENCTSKSTVIQYMTDGMLLREILTEPDLASYSCMVIDEAHERTLHSDILFGLVKDIVRFRPDLKLIISSATMDAEKFSKYFDDASIFMIPGRMFPVNLFYTKSPEADYVDAAVVTILQIHVSQPLNGDILVFLTGQEEIETAAEILTQRTRNLGARIPELMICPVFANLPSEQQAKIFEKTPKGTRKVVLATNIAETSLTIDGICYVIDTGFNKQKSYNARSGMESLVVTPVSQAAANQRAGPAERTQPGKCFRLFTAWSFQHELDANTVPEILRTNLGNVVLMLKSLGINDLLNFDFMDRPPADALIRALEQLYALGALNDRGELTKLGRRMAEFPLEPMLSKSVIASEKYECVTEVLSTVSMLSLGASVFYRPKDKAVHADTARLNFARGGGGDHISLLRCYTEWASTDYNTGWCFENYVQVRSMKRVRDIREQLESLCERVEIDHTVSKPEDNEATLKAITAGFFYNIAKLGRTGDYQTVKQQKTVYIHPSSVLAKDETPPPWLLFFELAFTTKEFMRQVAPINPEWLIELAPHYYQQSDVEDTKSKKMPKSRNRR